MKCADITSDESGKHVMLYQPSMFRMPAGVTVSVPILSKYDFDDNGKIVSYSAQFDTAALEAYNFQRPYSSQVATPAVRNMETVQFLCKTFQTMAGQTVNDALMQKLLSEMSRSYETKIDCKQVQTSEEFGFSLHNVPLAACFAECSVKYGGMQVIDVMCGDSTSDLNGKQVMIYQPSRFRLTTGQTVSVPIVIKYDFNDEGKIVASSTQFDTSTLQTYNSQSAQNSEFEPAAAKNAATIKYTCKLFKLVAGGQTVDQALMDRLTHELMGFSAPKINCEQVPTSKELGFSLRQVPISACFAESAKKYGGWKIIDVECEDITVDESGRSVMLYQQSTFKLPSGQTISMPIVSKYDFNDHGEVLAYSTQFDASAFKTYPQFSGSHVTSLATQNVATIKYLCKSFQSMMGQTVDKAFVQKLLPEMMSAYAPAIDCNQVSSSEEFGFTLQGVPASACFAECAKKYGGLQLIDVRCEDPAVDSSGKKVMSYQPSMFRLTTGQTVTVPIIIKYDFDDEGKVVASSTQFDTSVLQTYMTQSPYHSQVSTASAKNSATVDSLCGILQQMSGQTVSERLMEKLMPEMTGFYASMVNCNQVGTSEEFGFSLHGVPVGECFAEGAKKYAGLHIADISCDDIAADTTGKTVMIAGQLTFETSYGSSYGHMTKVPMFSKYNFNSDGKIVAYSSQYDTSALVSEVVENKSASVKLLASPSFTLWSAVAIVLSFAFGSAVALLAMRVVTKRHQTPLLQDSQNPYA
jgi:hypothetical protein